MTRSEHVFVKPDFLTKRELRALTKYVFEHEPDFTPSTVIAHDGHESSSDPSYRKSMVLYNLGEYASTIQDRLYALLPEVLTAFKREPFPISHLDIQVTASNDGDLSENIAKADIRASAREISGVPER